MDLILAIRFNEHTGGNMKPVIENIEFYNGSNPTIRIIVALVSLPHVIFQVSHRATVEIT